ncbi:Hypothetical protein PHPALM_925 [Phytophthora palmivora]|uniref:PiggyBac transposable element-derived protein domain-containing protein n=1 Tax=Phytophthora palmivora TaxID=4796 RepID=A0A2P4YTL1_9STRA|nr:Hypothetical protein PHPALM_925 [Phytophthora palmivora]
METMKQIMPYKLCRFTGLLVARTIAPNHEKLSNHWKTTYVGAISRGCFSSVLSRDRFMVNSRTLHFNSNLDPRAQTDRAWKLRKVVEVLRKNVFSWLHCTILPSRSAFNTIRMYLKDKPHKWGTKLFVLGSAVTAYCIRYCWHSVILVLYYAVYHFKRLLLYAT